MQSRISGLAFPTVAWGYSADASSVISGCDDGARPFEDQPPPLELPASPLVAS
ncbi:hypothetical protein U1Q18_037737, partial [Sarracenia purpurea var. burkii]